MTAKAYKTYSVPKGRCAGRGAPHVVVHSGFALVVTVSMMVLIAVVCVSLLSLATISLRQSKQSTHMQEARANARMALMIAIGELQKEMGPDMRVSASAAILDESPETEAIDGLEHPHWLASYESWGNWLNHKHEVDGQSLDIQSTYVAGREPMFRRWLVSLPAGQEQDIEAPKLGAEDSFVVMVGSGSAGDDVANHVWAHRVDVAGEGRYAWWVGAENQKAKVSLAARTRDLAADEWATAQGTTAQVGVGAMSDMDAIDEGTAEMDELVSKVITLQTLSVQALGVGRDVANNHFFDLTDGSKGLLTNVRSGGLKKDLSLLLDRDNDDLPPAYQYQSGANAEPSIRPLSSDILAMDAKVPNRPFASWPAMRHYYRMYRTNSDTQLWGSTHTEGHGSLLWKGATPYTNVLSTQNFRPERSNWTGENAYMRVPIIAKLTFLHSIKTEPNPNIPGERLLRHVFSPVITIWNPYTTEMRFPSGKVGFPASINHTWPIEGHIYRDDAPRPGLGSSGLGSHGVYLHADTGFDIVLKPGELKVFSYRDLFLQERNNPRYSMYPGFDPSAIGGNVSNVERSYPAQEISADMIGIKIAFNKSWQ